mmetsp:Transcript_16324/g.49700  ORF Transcript_16324/g.49700 Transcript_16324/m.49700 type:complete len:253 (-) Transcript_16324:2717-3475(-)
MSPRQQQPMHNGRLRMRLSARHALPPRRPRLVQPCLQSPQPPVRMALSAAFSRQCPRLCGCAGPSLPPAPLIPNQKSRKNRPKRPPQTGSPRPLSPPPRPPLPATRRRARRPQPPRQRRPPLPVEPPRAMRTPTPPARVRLTRHPAVSRAPRQLIGRHYRMAVAHSSCFVHRSLRRLIATRKPKRLLPPAFCAPRRRRSQEVPFPTFARRSASGARTFSGSLGTATLGWQMAPGRLDFQAPTAHYSFSRPLR